MELNMSNWLFENKQILNNLAECLAFRIQLIENKKSVWAFLMGPADVEKLYKLQAHYSYVHKILFHESDLEKFQEHLETHKKSLYNVFKETQFWLESGDFIDDRFLPVSKQDIRSLIEVFINLKVHKQKSSKRTHRKRKLQKDYD